MAILGCTGFDVTEVEVGDTVLVNNQPVRVDRFSIADTTSRPSCDDGEPLADLNLKLNRLEFIQTFLNSGACENGDTPWSLAVPDDEEGFFVGTDTIILKKCEKL